MHALDRLKTPEDLRQEYQIDVLSEPAEVRPGPLGYVGPRTFHIQIVHRPTMESIRRSVTGTSLTMVAAVNELLDEFTRTLGDLKSQKVKHGHCRG